MIGNAVFRHYFTGDTTLSALESLTDHVRQTAMLDSVQSLLYWDERTYLPALGGDFRADQITTLSSMLHQRRTDPRVGEWLSELSDDAQVADPHSDVGTLLRQVRREYEKQTKLPQRLVEEVARYSVTGQQAWVEARKSDDFSKLAPFLEKLLSLKREQADALGYPETRYDALLDEYEPNARTRTVRETLERLRQDLVPLVQTIQDANRSAPIDHLKGHFPTAAQSKFGRSTATSIGFDFQRGRLDVTEHPFCTELGPNDCRILTNYDESFFPSALFSTLHEAGHGMYEQGLRSDQYGLPAGQYVSLGIHESQSRLWENQVGRSHAFWEHFYPTAQQAFKSAFGNLSIDDFYFAINDVRPSLIRIEADEATYNLHIIIRFEIEQELINDELQVADLPGAWASKYQEYLGITPPNDADGVLQDIHWSGGDFGYFPTYSLGNLYAAQFFEAADDALAGVDSLMRRGEFQPLLEWLRENVHVHGQCYSPDELIERATHKPLSHEPLMRHLRAKLEPLYLQ